MITPEIRIKIRRLNNLFQLSKKWWDNDLINTETHVNQLFRITKLSQLIQIKKEN